MYKRNIFIKLFGFVFVLGFTLLSALPAYAATGQVVISVVKQEGGPLPGTYVTCLSLAPTPPSGYPPVPTITQLIANSSGQATWTTEYISGYSYRCFPSASVSPDYCYSFGGQGAKYFDFSSSLAQNYVITGHKNPSAPSSCTASSTSQSNTTAKPSLSSPTTTAAPTPTLKITKIKVSGKDVTVPKDANSAIVAMQGNRIVMSGTSTDLSKIVVKVYSEPKTYTAIVKSDGTWVISIPTGGLATEMHKVEFGGPDSAPLATLSLKVNTLVLPSSSDTPVAPYNWFIPAILGLLVLVFGLFSYKYRVRIKTLFANLKARIASKLSKRDKDI